MYRTLLQTLALLLAPTLALAADDNQNPPPFGGAFGALVMWWICNSRRKEEIGGWLLYFYIQLYIGVIVSLVAIAASIRNYLPTAWAANLSLYPLFLLSTVPGVLVLLVQLIIAERLRKSRDYRYVHSLRTILWVDLAASAVAMIVDLSSFKANLVLDVLGLVWPLVWLPYFYRSRRVARVFETKDWLATPPPAAAA